VHGSNNGTCYIMSLALMPPSRAPALNFAFSPKKPSVGQALSAWDGARRGTDFVSLSVHTGRGGAGASPNRIVHVGAQGTALSPEEEHDERDDYPAQPGRPQPPVP
jgi:hypothetical protein